jgi:hypothetical protein
MRSSLTLPGGLLAATFAITLVLPAAPAAAAPVPDLSAAIDRVEAELAGPPDLSRQPEGPSAGTAVFQASQHANDNGVDATTAGTTITCLITLTDPHVALVPTHVQATTRVNCTFPLSVLVAGVALYRQGENSSLASAVAAGFATNGVEATASTPCQTSAYVAVGTATAFAPPGFSPPVAHITLVSNVVLIAATGTPAPPLTCTRPPQPTPTPPANPPPPGLAPVISDLRCEYIGSNRFFCSLSATGWTQIRWTYNGFARTAWNNKLQTGIQTCAGGIPTVKAYVSNAHGTTTRQQSFTCSGPPL